MASGSQATVRTYNDYSGSNVRATRHYIVTYCNYESSCWVHYWTYIEPELRACQILMEQSKEKAGIDRIILPYQ